jgi:hypothetical protein
VGEEVEEEVEVCVWRPIRSGLMGNQARAHAGMRMGTITPVRLSPRGHHDGAHGMSHAMMLPCMLDGRVRVACLVG